MKIIAKTFKGLEEVLAQEIEDLGGTDIFLLKRGVEFKGNKELLYRANYQLRTAIRILTPIFQFKAKTQEEFYDKMFAHNWDHYMGVEDTFAIDAVCFSEVFTHSKFLAYKSKDALVDKFRKLYDVRPNVNVLNPTIRFNVHLFRDHFNISLDSSGDSLHKRGYRIDTGEAPLNEVMAAGLVLLSGWKADTPLLDPMCGSGTIAIEAARYALGLPPHMEDRGFGFMKWKNFDGELWQKIKDSQKDKKDSIPNIYARDINLGMVKKAKNNAISAEVFEHITVERKDFFQSHSNEKIMLITNPPYDLRIRMDDIGLFYKKMGDTFKHGYKDCSAWVFSGNIDAIKKLGLKTSQRFTLMNSQIETKFHKFDIYEGK